MRRIASLLTALATVACAGPGEDEPAPCDYPAGAVEPMAQGGVLFPYSWPVALDATRTERTLDLNEAYCDADDDIAWSPFDMLLFVSIPAW